MNRGFILDGRLAADTEPVAALELSDVRLMDDARFPWLVLVPRVPGVIELIDLGTADRMRLVEEVAVVAHALRAATSCDKLNVGTLGNIVRQLHVHVVARFAGDLAWPGPVWGAGEAVAYRTPERERLVGTIRDGLLG